MKANIKRCVKGCAQLMVGMSKRLIGTALNALAIILVCCVLINASTTASADVSDNTNGLLTPLTNIATYLNTIASNSTAIKTSQATIASNSGNSSLSTSGGNTIKAIYYGLGSVSVPANTDLTKCDVEVLGNYWGFDDKTYAQTYVYWQGNVCYGKCTIQDYYTLSLSLKVTVYE